MTVINKQQQFIKEAYIPYGDFLFHFTATFPYLVWLYFIYKVYYKLFINKNNNKILGYIELSIITILPAIFISLPSIHSLTGEGNTLREKATIADLQPDWPLCFDSNVDKNHPDGVIGEWDFKCGEIQSENNRHNTMMISQRFYYINFGLFMLVLLLEKIYKRGVIRKYVIDDNTLQYKLLAIPLLLGLIGSITSLYEEFFLPTYWLIEVFSSFLTLNIMAFIILLYLLVKVKFLHI